MFIDIQRVLETVPCNQYEKRIKNVKRLHHLVTMLAFYEKLLCPKDKFSGLLRMLKTDFALLTMVAKVTSVVLEKAVTSAKSKFT